MEREQSPAQVLVRRLLPATLALPLLIGFLRLEGERAGFYSTAVGVLIFAAAAMAGATALLLWTAGALERVDRRRARAERERRELGQALHHAERLEAIGRLAGGVAHEFNNVLLAIGAHGTLLLERVEHEADLRQEVERIVDSAQGATSLTRQLLAFGRRQELVLETVDLNALVARTLALVRPLLPSGIEVATELEPELHPVTADPGQLEQVLVNLVLNARDAIADSGTITVSTAALRLDAAAAEKRGIEPGAYVALEVSDTGCGMDEHTVARVFEPFFTTKAGEGTGLGLATAYGIVRQGGGCMTVDSVPGRGTTMTALLRRP